MTPDPNPQTPDAAGAFRRPALAAVVRRGALRRPAARQIVGRRSLEPAEMLEYSQFKSLVAQGQVAEVADRPRHHPRHATRTATGAQKAFTTVRVEDPKLAEQLDAQKVRYSGEVRSRVARRAARLGAARPAASSALWTFFLRRMGGAEGGIMSFARSRAKIYAEDDVKVSFADVAGVDEAADELREIVEFLKTPAKYTTLGGRIPKGVHARRPAGHGQDAAGARRRRRSEGAVLQPERLGVRRDVRRRRRRARARPVPAGRGQGALHRLHRRTRRARQGAHAVADGRPRGARADAQPAARRDGRLRFARRASSSWPRPTGPRCSTRRCCARAASIGRCSSTSPTSRGARRSCGST